MDKFIDITFDFRSDTPKGKDPDKLSPTLRSYHKYLWSKPLPNGIIFELDDGKHNTYLYHESVIGQFHLSSDSAIHTFSKWASMASIVGQLKESDIEDFRKIGYTIGAMMVFPSNRVDGKNTINAARGFHPLIKDRIDLTLECIRRFYINEKSPLSEVLNRYASFFNIFISFKCYVEFFLLQDLVVEDFSTIYFFMPFDNFKSSAVPLTLDSYLSYKSHAIEFVQNRNQRIFDSIN